MDGYLSAVFKKKLTNLIFCWHLLQRAPDKGMLLTRKTPNTHTHTHTHLVINHILL